MTEQAASEVRPRSVHRGPTTRRRSLSPFHHPRLVPQPPSGPGWLHELKLDGDRFQVRVAAGRASWRSRSGADRSTVLPDLNSFPALPDCILDGELCALEAKDRPDFSLLRARLGARQRGAALEPTVFLVFDLLYLERRQHRFCRVNRQRRIRQARFKGLRTDKRPTEVMAERPEQT